MFETLCQSVEPPFQNQNHPCFVRARRRHAMPVCREVYPPETRLGSGRLVRCHLYSQ